MKTNWRTVTTEDLIATIAADEDWAGTFEARAEFTRRTRSDWRTFAPARPRAEPRLTRDPDLETGHEETRSAVDRMNRGEE